MDKIREALVVACGEMDKKAREMNYVGGAYDETQDYKYAFAFSGGISEDDLIVAQHGIACLKSQIEA
ncbi:MAG: hypothetical protein MJY88_09400 [Bacteroidales bacterium]|nr:hypothetical protein [Bacteroidales bacterium]